MTNDPRAKPSAPKTLDLFAEQVAPEDLAGGAEEGQGMVREPSRGERGPGSVAWYALQQQEYREEGIRSASEYWRAKGVRWPAN